MGANKGKEYNYPTLLCFFEIDKDDQKEFCIKLKDSIRHEKDIRFEIKGSPGVKFNVSFKINHKIYLIQDIFDNSEATLNDSLNKMYILLDGFEDEFKKLNQKKIDKSIETKQNKKKVKTIFFESTDQRINYKLNCNNNSIFKDIEEELYKKFAEFRNIKKFYLCNGSPIDINKTFEENKIKDNSHIIIVINEISSINESLSSII